MKKIINLTFVFFVLMLIGCEVDPLVFDGENGQTVATFASTSGTLPVPEEGATFELTVESTTKSNVDRTIVVEVDDSSTADPSEYDISSTSLVIPAEEYTGTVLISGNFDAIPDLTTTTLVLNLNGLDGTQNEADYRSEFSLDMFKKCPSELEGTYIALSTGASTDGGTGFPTVNNFEYEVTIERTGDLTYTISDGVAGVYIEWYSPYGYTFETEGNFIDVCNTLSGSWQDAFGSTIVINGSVNDDGTLTIDWVNGFGDEVTATYTKQ